ncbi:MAG: 3-oxoacyl-[acyl-carrier-protein] synthase-1 [Gammaproteobacteria bacterium]|jgi:3-oxoacyl-[acyl-carrier-protein] synthase-1
MNRRVVITGMGIVAPNAIGLDNFKQALLAGKSGIRHYQELEKLGFGCQIGGKPDLSEEVLAKYFTPLQLKNLEADGVLFGCLAGLMAWEDSAQGKCDSTDWDAGCIMGAGLAGADVIRKSVYAIDGMNVRRLGSSTVPQTMSSGVSAHLGGMIGLGNQVTTNASACSTGTEAVLMGFDRIRSGNADRMLVGGCDSASPYVWAGFDAMRVTSRKHNDSPEEGSRPLSSTASGFVPGGGAGALVLESLESALARKAPIYAEVLGGHSNSGGQRNGGSMTAPNPEGIERCITRAMNLSGVQPADIDLISGHLTATIFDPYEVKLWSKSLNRSGENFPYINSLKSMTGHCLSASGAMECIASTLQIKDSFVHPTINLDELHSDVAATISADRAPNAAIHTPVRIAASSSFGFGDVNSVIILKRFEA